MRQSTSLVFPCTQSSLSHTWINVLHETKNAMYLHNHAISAFANIRQIRISRTNFKYLSSHNFSVFACWLCRRRLSRHIGQWRTVIEWFAWSRDKQLLTSMCRDLWFSEGMCSFLCLFRWGRGRGSGAETDVIAYIFDFLVTLSFFFPASRSLSSSWSFRVARLIFPGTCGPTAMKWDHKHWHSLFQRQLRLDFSRVHVAGRSPSNKTVSPSCGFFFLFSFGQRNEKRDGGGGGGGNTRVRECVGE